MLSVLLCDLGGNRDLNDDQLIAPSVAPQAGDALAAKADDLAALSARRDFYLGFTV